MLSYSVLESKIDPTYTPCIHMTRSGQGVTWTLLHHTHFPAKERPNETCVHNKATYSICQQEGQYICFDHQIPLLMKIG